LIRRFSLINGVLRLGFHMHTTFRGHIYVPLVPEGYRVFEKVQVDFGRQINPFFSKKDVATPLGEDVDVEAAPETQLCQFEILTTGVPLFA
jgi:hypothetical protein